MSGSTAHQPNRSVGETPEFSVNEKKVRGNLPSGGTEYLTGAVPGQQTSQLAKEGQPGAAENNVSRPGVKSQEETEPPRERAQSSHSVAGTPRAVSGQGGNETSVNENPSVGNETGYGTLERERAGKAGNEESGQVRYSREEGQGGGMSVDELRLLADTLVESFHNAPGIVVADRPQDAIPNAFPDGIGLFDPNNGKVFLFARNIRDADTARAVFAHDVIAHYGLRGFFGDSLGDVLVSIRNHNPKIERLSLEWWSENQDYIKQVRENEGRNWTEEQFEKWQAEYLDMLGDFDGKDIQNHYFAARIRHDV